MLYFPCEAVYFEGPDCSGKTTLIEQLHKQTKYRWHLADRSHVSRALFSRMYGRNLHFCDDFSKKELYNLNNRFVMLFPPWKEIKRRYNQRGDEIHDLTGLREVYDQFYDEYRRLMFYPNVISITEGSVLSNAVFIENRLDTLENMNLKSISDYIKSFSKNCPTQEASGLTFSLYENCKFDEDDPDVMMTKGEEKYYRLIKSSFLNKIKDELAGKNEYNEKQSIFSRRFIHTNDSCISLVHALYRDNLLDMHFVLRSTNVEKTLYHDLKFLYHLSKCAYLALSPDYISFVKMRFTLNSAHIVR